MANYRQPRRPAMLDPARAEQIVGDEDPAMRSEVAHTTARALVEGGRAGGGEDPELVARLVAIADTEGIDAIAELWSRSPHTTLPGALWRLYLLREWVRRDPGAVSERYRDGMGRAEVHDAIAGVASPPGPGEVKTAVDDVLSGVYREDLSVALDRAASFLRVLATGSAVHAEWIDSDDDELATQVTRRASALQTTAEELGEAATLYRAGRLD